MFSSNLKKICGLIRSTLSPRENVLFAVTSLEFIGSVDWHTVFLLLVFFFSFYFSLSFLNEKVKINCIKTVLKKLRSLTSP